MRFPNKYKGLRKNASLAAVAKAAAIQSRMAHREWRDYYRSLKEAKGNTSGEHLSYLDDLSKYMDECILLAKHLNRLAGTDWPIFCATDKEKP